MKYLIRGVILILILSLTSSTIYADCNPNKNFIGEVVSFEGSGCSDAEIAKECGSTNCDGVQGVNWANIAKDPDAIAALKDKRKTYIEKGLLKAEDCEKESFSAYKDQFISAGKFSKAAAEKFSSDPELQADLKKSFTDKATVLKNRDGFDEFYQQAYGIDVKALNPADISLSPNGKLSVFMSGDGSLELMSDTFPGTSPVPADGGGYQLVYGGATTELKNAKDVASTDENGIEVSEAEEMDYETPTGDYIHTNGITGGGWFDPIGNYWFGFVGKVTDGPITLHLANKVKNENGTITADHVQTGSHQLNIDMWPLLEKLSLRQIAIDPQK